MMHDFRTTTRLNASIVGWTTTPALMHEMSSGRQFGEEQGKKSKKCPKSKDIMLKKVPHTDKSLPVSDIKCTCKMYITNVV